MRLAAGTKLGHYEVISTLGAGGMGEVYRAKDTKLGREVAIKLLLNEVSADPERLARFEREARVLASLNHPNIASLHAFERDGDTRFLVMELVEGPTLADRIAGGAIPVGEALAIFRQIAEGLGTAHESGVIHRDLKPANIKVSEGGQAKILDFGLAKAVSPEARSDPSMTQSPTMTLAATMRGEILGTAAYMSPEQARGLPVDKRADVWAFGVCLFETLTGGRVFEGSDATEVIAAVIRDQPDLDALPPDAPAAIRRLLRRCLEKDPRRRLRDIGDAAIEIDDAVAGDPDVETSGEADVSNVPPPWWRRALPLAGAMVVGAVLAIAGLGDRRTAPPVEKPIHRLRMVGPSGLFTGLALSRDGSELVYTGSATSGLQRRSLSDFETTLIAGTEGFQVSYPAFSPDGRSIAFSGSVTGSVETIPLNGGVAVTVAETEGPVTGLSWPDDSLLVAVGSQGILRIPAVGGAAEQLVTMQAGEFAALPQLLPGGRAVLYTLATGSPTVDWREARIVVQSLESGERSEVVGGSDGRYLETGHLVYAVEGVWFASAFDLDSRRVVGSPVAMLPGVGRVRIRGLVQPDVAVVLSQDGTLVYWSGPASISNERDIALVDRLGEAEVLAIPARAYESPRISPDGRHLAVSTDDGRDASVWVYDMSRETTLRRLTFSSRSRYPVWSPDSRRLAYQSDEGGEPSIWVRPADGAQEAERWTTAESGAAHIPESWSSDGRYLSYSLVTESGVELWLYSIEGGRAEPFGDVREPFPLNSVFSPDGRWIAYTARTGGASVFVQPVPATGTRYQINEETIAHHPFWNPRGGEIFYFGRGGAELVSAPITLVPSFGLGTAELVLGDHPSDTSVLAPLDYDMLRDGQSFVRTQPVGGVEATAGIDVSGGGLHIVLNWFEELKRRVPTD